MEILSMASLLLLAQIIIIDILLAGDNAVVIGMAARNLPVSLQKKAIFWGTAGAIGLRLIMAFLFVEALNNIPYLHLVGGILLLWISYSLMVEKEEEHNIEAKSNLKEAILTIVVADGVMSVDNVLAVVGTAHGHMLYVMIGMLITVPIIIWGSTIFIKMIDRFPIILYAGGCILGWVAGSMMAEDQVVEHILGGIKDPFALGCAVLALVAALITNKINSGKNDKKDQANG